MADTAISDFRRQVEQGMRRRNQNILKAIFNYYQDLEIKLVLKENLPSALADLGIEVDETELDEILFSIDAKGDVGLDFDEFQRAVSRPSSVEQWFGELPLAQMVADAMPRVKGMNPLRALSTATVEQLESSCLAFSEGLLKLMKNKISSLKDLYISQDLAESNLVAAKFELSKMSVGKIEDFYAGLGTRIGVKTNSSLFFIALIAWHTTFRRSQP